MIRLKELREKKNISQKELGRIFNVAQNTISNWEMGKREPDTETLIELAKFFGVTVDQLLGRKNVYKNSEGELLLCVNKQGEKYESNFPSISSKKPALSKKDLKELKRDAEYIKTAMMSVTGLAFNGKPQDEETLEKVMAALEEAMILARKEAQRKYTPKKYRKKDE